MKALWITEGDWHYFLLKKDEQDHGQTLASVFYEASYRTAEKYVACVINDVHQGELGPYRTVADARRAAETVLEKYFSDRAHAIREIRRNNGQ